VEISYQNQIRKHIIPLCLDRSRRRARDGAGLNSSQIRAACEEEENTDDLLSDPEDSQDDEDNGGRNTPTGN